MCGSIHKYDVTLYTPKNTNPVTSVVDQSGNNTIRWPPLYTSPIRCLLRFDGGARYPLRERSRCPPPAHSSAVAILSKAALRRLHAARKQKRRQMLHRSTERVPRRTLTEKPHPEQGPWRRPRAALPSRG
ncbi:hypothetical protein NDU88_012975 [Pleurodeles waltl]|uniref:Uncharacterized protein n=1 Tax=Pleurodeles waltl TaxID=8319 RepID=A0AAV7R7D6_PLEWA|nr:hypothetical protein NDU88_012975 [Pleurodeles waltl]